MEKPTNGCFISLPYPTVANARDKRKNTLEMIYKLYISKFTAVSEYIYRNLIFSESHPIAADMLECISLIQMKHFKLLGKLLAALGVDPKINPADINRRSKRSDHLTDVNYKTLRNIVLNNIYVSKSFISELDTLMQMTDDSEIKAVTQRLILDERHIIGLLEELIM